MSEDPSTVIVNVRELEDRVGDANDEINVDDDFLMAAAGPSATLKPGEFPKASQGV